MSYIIEAKNFLLKHNFYLSVFKKNPMKFQRKFGKRRKSNPKKGLLLLVLLLLALFLWYQAENIIASFFD